VASYTDLPSAQAAAIATLTAAASTYSWPSAVLTGTMQEVDAAYYAANGWFSSNATECEAFWAHMHSGYAFWDHSQKGMDKIGTWLAAEAHLAESKAATADAQSATTIAAGTAAGAAEDAAAIATAGGQAAGELATLAQQPSAWLALAAAVVAFLAWKVAR